jgi:hypothetical protein
MLDKARPDVMAALSGRARPEIIATRRWCCCGYGPRLDPRGPAIPVHAHQLCRLGGAWSLRGSNHAGPLTDPHPVRPDATCFFSLFSLEGVIGGLLVNRVASKWVLAALALIGSLCQLPTMVSVSVVALIVNLSPSASAKGLPTRSRCMSPTSVFRTSAVPSRRASLPSVPWPATASRRP